jgi:hypothetical protein
VTAPWFLLLGFCVPLLLAFLAGWWAIRATRPSTNPVPWEKPGDEPSEAP